jgi:hypothetical protein
MAYREKIQIAICFSTHADPFDERDITNRMMPERSQFSFPFSLTGGFSESARMNCLMSDLLVEQQPVFIVPIM